MSTIRDLIDLVTQLNESTLDRKFATELREIQRMIITLQSEQTFLAEKNFTLLKENEGLKAEISVFKNTDTAAKENKSRPINKISQDEENILQFLATVEEADVREIQHATSLQFVKTEFWLAELEDKEMISGSFFVEGQAQYYLSQNGRRYLITNNLI